MNYLIKTYLLAYDSGDPTNTLGPWIPEIWAREGLLFLDNNLVAAKLVYRDYENTLATMGDTVNARVPATFVAKRKAATDDITLQAATTTSVAVKLDMHVYTSFILRDQELDRAFTDLVAEYMIPAMSAVANAIDRTVLGEVYQFTANSAGKLSTSPTQAVITTIDQVLSDNQCPQENRSLIVSPAVKNILLNIDNFVTAEKIGDSVTIRTGFLGQLFGINIYTTQNVPSISASTAVNEIGTSAIALSAGYAAGTTFLQVDAFTDDPEVGEWCTIAGDMTPQFITHWSASASTLGISPGLKYAVVDAAVVTAYKGGDINYSGGYAADYSKSIVINEFAASKGLKKMQMASTGITTATLDKYAVLPDDLSITNMLLTRPLQTLVANGALVAPGPAGGYNFALHPNAVALVNRPMATVPDGLGVKSAVMNDPSLGIALRVTMAYDPRAQGYIITVDTLLGIKTLNANLGAVMYS